MALPKTDIVTEEEFRRISLGDPQGRWELHHGRLRERTGMSVAHGDVLEFLAAMLRDQLDRNEYRVRAQHARLRVSSSTYYIPDVAVVPTSAVRALLENPRSLDAYPEPLPLVVEIWSPSTGAYDDDEKLPGYQRRGDLEIWRIHLYERTVTAWRRQPGGTYRQTISRDGLVQPAFLPGVTIDLAALFDQ